MPLPASYRLVDRDGNEIRVASFEPNISWRVGDPVDLGRDASYVIVEIRDGDALMRATWVVDRRP
jgi:hypothetical protein